VPAADGNDRRFDADGRRATSNPGIRSREELGRRLRLIARTVAQNRAAMAAEDAKAASRRNPRQITIAQILFLVALRALGLTAWRWIR
jgi:hypothetical protein